MPKFVIERTVPGAGNLTPDELRQLSARSCEVLKDLGKPYHWVQSYVTDDKIYCIHVAPDADTILEHARRGGFPADRVSEVKTTIDPTTAE